MTKQDLINWVAQKTGFPKSQVGSTLGTAIDGIKSALAKGQAVTFTGFGTFRVYSRKSRQGRNPRTGATINIPAARVPKFRPGKALKSAVK